MNMNNELPLVSVPVITYNSSETVIETLDSIYNQTYPNLELIISDDCSTDNTVEICRNWIAQYAERFVRTEIITVKNNTGVSANVNRSHDACRGEWIKGMSGDDMLVPQAIKEYINYVTNHQDIYWCFSRAKCFGTDDKQVELWQINHECDFYNWSKEDLLDYLHFCGCPFFSPTSFYSRNKLIESNIIADERVRNADDRTRWIKMIDAGFKIGFIDKQLVRYRISENSLSTRKIQSSAMALANQQFYTYYTIPYIWKKGYKWHATRLYMVNKRGITSSRFIKMFWKVVCKIVKSICGPVPTIENAFNIQYAYWVKNENRDRNENT